MPGTALALLAILMGIHTGECIMGRLIDLSRQRIAIAGGDIGGGADMGSVLRDMGAGSVTLLTDLTCALREVHRPTSDLLLCDADVMPKAGLPLLYLGGVLANASRLPVPIVLFTRWPTRDWVLTASRAGAKGVLAWPCSPIQLAGSLARALGLPAPARTGGAFWFESGGWWPPAPNPRP